MLVTLAASVPAQRQFDELPGRQTFLLPFENPGSLTNVTADAIIK